MTVKTATSLTFFIIFCVFGFIYIGADTVIMVIVILTLFGVGVLLVGGFWSWMGLPFKD